MVRVRIAIHLREDALSIVHASVPVPLANRRANRVAARAQLVSLEVDKREKHTAIATRVVTFLTEWRSCRSGKNGEGWTVDNMHA